MNFKVFFYSITFLSVFCAFGQSTIEGDLIQLSRLTFDKSPIIKRNELQIDNSEASFQIQRSTFDYQFSSGLSLSNKRDHLFTLDSRNVILGNDDIIETRNTGFSLALQRKFRTGLSANINVDYSQLADNFPIDRFNQNVGEFISNHTVSSTFSLTQPLLRGRGLKITTAQEKSASLQLESTQYNFELTSSFELLQMGVAYWQYLAAYKNLAVFKQNEERVGNVLRITKELVKADKKPAGDLIQIMADLANQERQTRVAEQNLHNARVNLSRAIGLDERESTQIGIPTNEFPTIDTSGFDENIAVDLFINLAKENRKDLKAFEKQLQALELRLDLAFNNRKPQLDLTGFVSYGGMNMGNGVQQAFNSVSNTEGRNYTVGARLNLSFPISNNLARGTFLQNKTAVTDQEIATNNLGRNIDLNVSIALNNLKNSVLILQKAEETLGYYQNVFANEQIKFQNGLTTLLNLILFQERLTFAQLEYLQAQQQFATAIINLRHETGTLITMQENRLVLSSITNDIYYTIPNF
ncbi:TolC family protein [Aquimarina sp. 2201CG1-2-11]|uniref:TolC family protein n=1 Tax=Aquimarina discodermiae TaxID=3231043 RepID=UPI0034620BD6